MRLPEVWHSVQSCCRWPSRRPSAEQRRMDGSERLLIQPAGGSACCRMCRTCGWISNWTTSSRACSRASRTGCCTASADPWSARCLGISICDKLCCTQPCSCRHSMCTHTRCQFHQRSARGNAQSRGGETLRFSGLVPGAGADVAAAGHHVRRVRGAPAAGVRGARRLHPPHRAQGAAVL